MTWRGFCRMHSSRHDDYFFLLTELESSLFFLLWKQEQTLHTLMLLRYPLTTCHSQHMNFPSFTRVNQNLFMIVNWFYFLHLMTQLLQKLLILFVTERISVRKVNLLLFQELEINMQLCVVFFCLVLLMKKITFTFAESQRDHYYL